MLVGSCVLALGNALWAAGRLTDQPLAALDPALKSHLRYPHYLFNIQSHLYATYHMTNRGGGYGLTQVEWVP